MALISENNYKTKIRKITWVFWLLAYLQPYFSRRSSIDLRSFSRRLELWKKKPFLKQIPPQRKEICIDDRSYLIKEWKGYEQKYGKCYPLDYSIIFRGLMIYSIRYELISRSYHRKRIKLKYVNSLRPLWRKIV